MRLNPDLPPALEEIILRAFEKDRDIRYQTCSDLRAELKLLKRDTDSGRADAVETGRGALRAPTAAQSAPLQRGWAIYTGATLGVILLAAAGAVALPRHAPPPSPQQRGLTRITFDSGLQSEPTWSPDGQFIAYSSDRSGNFDIWVQQVSGGNPVQITNDPAHDWQPHWSPDGKQIVFRSERDGGGLFVVPAFGGTERMVSSIGYRPLWLHHGKTIYFLSSRSGFWNVWGIHFDTAKWKPAGQPFLVTSLERPAQIVPGLQETSVAKDRLVLPVTEVSGSIWILEDVDR